jgi:hypothetical protein
MRRLLFATIALLLASPAIAADYFVCMHDAAEAREECFRWALKNHVSDSTCNPEFNASVQACERLRPDAAPLTGAPAQPPPAASLSR